mgnify:CR=1 FL=1
MNRLILSIPNFRDIGGYLSPYGKIKEGVIFRSGNLSKSSTNDLLSLQKFGIKNVIDLRSHRAKNREIDPTSVSKDFTYCSFFIKAGEKLPLSKEGNFALYEEMFTSKEELLPILKEIISLGKGTLIHCSAGKDRTGVIVSLLLLICNVSTKDINHEYLLSYDDLEDHLAYIKSRNLFLSPSYYLKDENFLPSILSSLEKRFGTFENYYHYLGLSGQDIKAIRSLLTK